MSSRLQRVSTSSEQQAWRQDRSTMDNLEFEPRRLQLISTSLGLLVEFGTGLLGTIAWKVACRLGSQHCILVQKTDLCFVSQCQICLRWQCCSGVVNGMPQCGSDSFWGVVSAGAALASTKQHWRARSSKPRQAQILCPPTQKGNFSELRSSALLFFFNPCWSQNTGLFSPKKRLFGSIHCPSLNGDPVCLFGSVTSASLD